jgi:hypothetical protein
MCGIGERGDDGDGMFYCGPSGWMQREQLLDDDLPVMVVSPQCPPNHLWYDPEMTDVIVRFLDVLVKDPRVDPDRLYITGMSMGGGGTVSVAAAGAKYFAAAAPLCPPFTPPDSVIPDLKDLPVWMIVGSDDGRFTEGAHTMADALRKEQANFLFTEIPGAGHVIWPNIYTKLEFYDWFLTHTRGQPQARTYSSAELMKIASDPVGDAQTQLVEHDFSLFAPYWQIINWSRQFDPGLHPDLIGKKNVFSAPPLNATTNCMMETTWTLPANQQSQLEIVAGRAPREDWQLIVNIDGKQIFSAPIDHTTAPEGWTTQKIDLSQWSGKEVDIQVNAKAGATPGPAYFAKLAVESGM